MVGHQTEGDWVLSLLKADFWGRDGNTFLFVIPPEGESTEIQSQLHWNGMCRTCCSWHKLCALWEEGENQAQRGAMCFIVHQNLSFFKDLSPEKPKNLDKVNLTKRVSTASTLDWQSRNGEPEGLASRWQRKRGKAPSGATLGPAAEVSLLL